MEREGGREGHTPPHTHSLFFSLSLIHRHTHTDTHTLSLFLPPSLGATWGSIVAAWEAKPVAGQQTGALVFSTARTIATNAGKLGENKRAVSH